jgi:hypothetical protein
MLKCTILQDGESTSQICIFFIHLHSEPKHHLMTVTFKNKKKYISQSLAVYIARNFCLNHITTLLQPLRIHHLPFLSALR